jgi:hypothetical protein
VLLLQALAQPGTEDTGTTMPLCAAPLGVAMAELLACPIQATLWAAGLPVLGCLGHGSWCGAVEMQAAD